MKTQIFLLTIICFTTLLSACTGSKSAEVVNLEGYTWVLVDLDGSDPLGDRLPTLKFEAGQVSGNAGCNHYGGSYHIEGDSIQFEGIFNTEMACLEPEGVMEQEQTYLDLLRKANSFNLEGDELIILIDQQPTLRLSKE